MTPTTITWKPPQSVWQRLTEIMKPKLKSLAVLGSKCWPILLILGAALFGGALVIGLFYQIESHGPQIDPYCWEVDVLGELNWILCKLHERMNQKDIPWLLFTSLAAAPSLVLTWILRDAHKRQDLKNTEERLVTERFTEAVKLLGHEKMEVRLGAIYALERVSRDSEKDHWTVVETLAAYVRENSPWPPKKNAEESNGENAEAASKSEEEEYTLATDIQAALTVLGRRQHREKEKDRIDLRKTDLRGAELFGDTMHFEKADFSKAHLEGAELWEAHFENAFFYKAILDKADFYDAFIEKAFFSRASLRNTCFREARLRMVGFSDSLLEGTDFVEANIEEANFEKAFLKKAFFTEATLKGANFCHASIVEVSFLKANLENVNFVGAYLEEVDAIIAEPIGANFQDAKLLSILLEDATLTGAKYNSKTIFPEGFKPEDHGMIKSD